MSHYIYEDGHLTSFDPVYILPRGLVKWGGRVMNLCMEMLGVGWSIPNTQKKKIDALTSIVLELANHYINLRIIEKFTGMYLFGKLKLGIRALLPPNLRHRLPPWIASRALLIRQLCFTKILKLKCEAKTFG